MISLMAWRNIWRNKMRSIVVILSVAIGLFSGIMVLGLYKGMMRGRIKTVIYAEVSHLQIHDTNFKKDFEPNYTIQNASAIITSLKKYTEVKAIATRTVTTGMLSTTTGSAGVQINGIETEAEQVVSQLNKKIKEGKWFNKKKTNEIFIGYKLAKKMKLKTGNKIVLTFTDIESNIVSSAFRVAAIYESNNAPLDEMNVYVIQNELNKILGLQNQIHEIAILLKKDELLESTQEKINNNLKNLSIENWKELSPETNLMVETVNISSYIIMAIILLALAFGIINTMLMAILERTNEIGMMLALGMNKFKMFLLVLSETIFLTFAGMPLGISVAWLVTNYFNKHGLTWGRIGKEMMNSFGFSTSIYPEFPSEKLAITTLFVLATALLSCIYPAVKALALNPSDALRK
jgi:putative ABC transport system permease protein